MTARPAPAHALAAGRAEVSRARTPRLASPPPRRLCSKVSGVSILAIAEHCPLMRALFLERAGRIADNAIVALAQNCPRLHTLDLGWCGITDASLDALSAHCDELSCLNLGYCDSVTDAGVRALAAGCRQLTSLDIGGCLKLSDASLDAVAQVRPARASRARAGPKDNAPRLRARAWLGAALTCSPALPPRVQLAALPPAAPRRAPCSRARSCSRSTSAGASSRSPTPACRP